MMMNDMNYACFLPTGNPGAEIQLGKLAVGGFHKTKTKHFQRRITDCSIVFQINNSVNLACFLNIMVYMVYMVSHIIGRVKNLHTAPLNHMNTLHYTKYTKLCSF